MCNFFWPLLNSQEKRVHISGRLVWSSWCWTATISCSTKTYFRTSKIFSQTGFSILKCLYSEKFITTHYLNPNFFVLREVHRPMINTGSQHHINCSGNIRVQIFIGNIKVLARRFPEVRMVGRLRGWFRFRSEKLLKILKVDVIEIWWRGNLSCTSEGQSLLILPFLS